MATEGSVRTAFDMLLDELAAAVDTANRAGAAAFESGDYDTVTSARDRARTAKQLMAKAAALRDEWVRLCSSPGGNDAASAAPKSRRLPRGNRLHANEFRLPILKALQEKGGKGRKGEVLQRVEELLRSRLGPIEYTPIPSDPKRMRWLVRAEWVRFRLVREGLMKSDSPRGIWEITDAGRDCLAKNQSAVINPQ